MNLDWTKLEFDWTEILDGDPSFDIVRIVKISYRLIRALAKTVVSQKSLEFVLQQSRPGGDIFYTRFVLRGFVFCTFLPNCLSRHFPKHCLTIRYANGKALTICVKGLVVNTRVEEFEETEFVSEEAAAKYYKSLRRKGP